MPRGRVGTGRGGHEVGRRAGGGEGAASTPEDVDRTRGDRVASSPEDGASRDKDVAAARTHGDALASAPEDGPDYAASTDEGFAVPTAARMRRDGAASRLEDGPEDTASADEDVGAFSGMTAQPRQGGGEGAEDSGMYTPSSMPER